MTCQPANWEVTHPKLSQENETTTTCKAAATTQEQGRGAEATEAAAWFRSAQEETQNE